jgi:hypothetical protein
MGERWIKEAEDLRPNGSAGVMSRNHGGVKVTWHVTVSPSGGTWFDAMHRVLTNKKSEPHLLWDPLTDRLGQYFPLDTGGRALGNDGDRPTNRDGTINIQIEVVGMPDGFTRYWKPGPNYRAMMRAIRSWGIPDVWPAGPVSPSGRADQQVPRSWSAYVKSGHFGHCHVPGNSHWDPGPIDTRAIFTAAPTTITPATPNDDGITPQEDDTDMASLSDITKAVRDGITAHWSESVSIPGETKPRTRNQILIWGYTRAGAAARDSQKALAVARAVARQQGLTDKQLDEIEDKVDRLIDKADS